MLSSCRSVNSLLVLTKSLTTRLEAPLSTESRRVVGNEAVEEHPKGCVPSVTSSNNRIRVGRRSPFGDEPQECETSQISVGARYVATLLHRGRSWLCPVGLPLWNTAPWQLPSVVTVTFLRQRAPWCWIQERACRPGRNADGTKRSRPIVANGSSKDWTTTTTRQPPRRPAGSTRRAGRRRNCGHRR